MLTITQDKVYLSDDSLHMTHYKYDEVKIIKDEDVFKYLGEDVDLGDDVTFERLFSLAIKHKEFLNQVFAIELNNCKIDDFIQDFEVGSKECEAESYDM